MDFAIHRVFVAEWGEEIFLDLLAMQHPKMGLVGEEICLGELGCTEIFPHFKEGFWSNPGLS